MVRCRRCVCCTASRTSDTVKQFDARRGYPPPPHSLSLSFMYVRLRCWYRGSLGLYSLREIEIVSVGVGREEGRTYKLCFR